MQYTLRHLSSLKITIQSSIPKILQKKRKHTIIYRRMTSEVSKIPKTQITQITGTYTKKMYPNILLSIPHHSNTYTIIRMKNNQNQHKLQIFSQDYNYLFILVIIQKYYIHLCQIFPNNHVLPLFLSTNIACSMQ